ncbi:MAG: pyruvate kinase [Planctomycetes bacterium]|nr:pyruvate kinase [Planctomycetota bacterium]
MQPPTLDPRRAVTQTADFSATIERSLAELSDLRRAMLAAESSVAVSRPAVHPAHAAGARNLAHYLALRAREMRPLQERLAHLGLSSLGRSEAHALASVEAVLASLGALGGARGSAAASPGPADFDIGARELAAHTDALLGPARDGRRVRILVTLSPEAAEDVARLRTWLEAGMDDVRINCAHDGPKEWRRMLEHLHRAEQACGRKARVLMDLAGPKLRTGPVEPGPCVVKIRPERDELGRVRVPARVWLSFDGERPADVDDAFVLPVDSELAARLAPATRAEAGERAEHANELEFVDARGARRSLRVVQSDRRGAWAETSQTSYVVAGTRFSRGKHELGAVGELAPLEGVVQLSRGERLVLTRALDPGRSAVRDAFGRTLAPATIGCTLGEIFGRVCVGERVFFDDGRIGGVIRSVEDERLVVEITEARDGGEKLRADKGINLPDSRLDLPALTAKDVEDLGFVVEHADAVGLSFVHRPEDVSELASRLGELGRPDLGVVLKIETRRAFERLPELLFAALQSPRVGVMIARGDLAVECGWERLAEAQEEILWLSEAAHVPVIWATQVLESLAKDGRPSRAEITDAAMSERAECVMLNKGPHVGEAISALDDILRRMQAHQHKKSSMLRPLRLATGW